MEDLNPERSKLITIVKPILLVNQFFGCCPFHIKHGKQLTFKPTSLNFIKTIISLIILSFYTLYLFFQIRCAIVDGENLVELTKLGAYISTTVITIGIICFLLIKQHDLCAYFNSPTLPSIAKYCKCDKAKKNFRIYYGIYLLLTTFSSGISAYQSFQSPKIRSNIFSYLFMDNEFQHKNGIHWAVFASCVFQLYFAMLIHSAYALIEVFCAILACGMGNMIKCMRQELKTTMDQIYVSESDQPLMIDIPYNWDKERTGEIGNYVGAMYRNGRLSPSEFITKATEGLKPAFNGNIITKKNGDCGLGRRRHASSTATADGMGAVKDSIIKFQFAAEKQRYLNDLFGGMIALNSAWLVIKTCLMLFIEIRSFATVKVVAETIVSTAAVVGIGIDPLLNGTSGPQAQLIPETDLLTSGAYFINIDGFSNSFRVIVMLFRLLALLIALGSVYHESKYFDNEIIDAIMKVNINGGGEFYGNGKAIACTEVIGLLGNSAAAANNGYTELIFTHLMRSNSNPVAFSAGGFFLFNKSTLLYSFSIITTYLVFLLQSA